MILLVHLLSGAVVASYVKNPLVMVALAFLSHYVLDFIPHAEYSIENIRNKKWQKALPDILKVILDFAAGIALIFFFSSKAPIIFIGALFSILPDGLSFLGAFLKNSLLKQHSEFHQGKIHFLKNKKISSFWRIFVQIIIALIFISLL